MKTYFDVSVKFISYNYLILIQLLTVGITVGITYRNYCENYILLQNILIIFGKEID